MEHLVPLHSTLLLSAHLDNVQVGILFSVANTSEIFNVRAVDLLTLLVHALHFIWNAGYTARIALETASNLMEIILMELHVVRQEIVGVAYALGRTHVCLV